MEKNEPKTVDIHLRVLVCHAILFGDKTTHTIDVRLQLVL